MVLDHALLAYVVGGGLRGKITDLGLRFITTPVGRACYDTMLQCGANPGGPPGVFGAISLGLQKLF